MEYPQSLIQIANKRAGEDAKLEGINYGAGPNNAKIMLIGEAPGKTEIENHIPFSGAAGKELTTSLDHIGLNRNDVYITSAVRSRPYSIKERKNRKTDQMETVYPNRKPTQREIKAHAILLDYEIKHVQPDLIVTLGDVALKRILGNHYQLRDDHGNFFQSHIQQIDDTGTKWIPSKKEFTVFATYHPAAVFYNRSLTSTIKNDFTLLGQWIKQRGWTFND